MSIISIIKLLVKYAYLTEEKNRAVQKNAILDCNSSDRVASILSLS